MARFVLVALVWSAVQGEEYVGGAMPQYGGVAADYAEPAAAIASADYTGHSPDASAPLDYKYIEHQVGSRERFQKEVDGTNVWESRPKERRNRPDKDELDMVDTETAISKHKPSRRSRHRSRLKNEKLREPRRRRNRNNRANEDNDDVRREFVRNNDYREDLKSDAFDDEQIPVKESTERVVRRRARDRHFAAPLKGIDMPLSLPLESEDDILGPVPKMKDIDKSLKDIDNEPEDEAMGSGRKKDEYNIDLNRRHGLGRAPGPQSFDDNDDDDVDLDLRKKSVGKRKFNKNYPDYNNYYDMKRVYNIKNRLPMLLRRTTTRIPSSDEDSDMTSDLVRLLWTARRAASPCTIALRTSTTELLLPSRTTQSYPRLTRTTTRTTTTTTEPPAVDPLRFVTETSRYTAATERIIESTTTIPTKQTNEQGQTAKHELSLAEKSRLSILKKAFRKESDKPAPSTKPPILLQVTSNLPTIVMVEPAPTGDVDPWMRARPVSNDSPQRLERVKRLMRQKLVSDAKNIKDLTDNWDDMVCDYIDTNLLDAQGCNVKVEFWLIIICYIICYVS